MKVARDIADIGRKHIMLLTAETFEEERILNMLETVVHEGGWLEMWLRDGRAIKATFTQKQVEDE